MRDDFLINDLSKNLNNILTIWIARESVSLMNILLIVCDTLRADHLGCYGYFRDTSPNIDRIAKKGVVFEDFYNAGSPTGPGFTCFYTGLYPINHKFYRFGEPNIRQVDDTVFTMAEILKACGYTTVAIDNLINFSAHSKHWVRGYDFYINPSRRAFQTGDLRAEDVNRRLIPWIRNYSGERFFLFVHYWDPHGPYNQPEEYRRLFHHRKGDLSDLEVQEAPAGYKYVPGWGKIDEIVEGAWQGSAYDSKYAYGPGQDLSVDLYDGEIAYMDHAIGEILEVLDDQKLLDETLIVITSDHGEQLGQHGIWGHAALHNAETCIPLIMCLPGGLPRGVRIGGLCQQIDLLPTMLDLLGKKTDILEINGRTVMPLIKGDQIRSRIFMENSSGQRSVQTFEWQLLDSELLDQNWIKLPRDLELYNVKEDPMEVINIAKTEKEKAQELREILRDWIRVNLKGEETDPIIYEGWDSTGKGLGKKIARLLELLEATGPS